MFEQLPTQADISVVLSLSGLNHSDRQNGGGQHQWVSQHQLFHLREWALTVGAASFITRREREEAACIHLRRLLHTPPSVLSLSLKITQVFLSGFFFLGGGGGGGGFCCWEICFVAVLFFQEDSNLFVFCWFTRS